MVEPDVKWHKVTLRASVKTKNLQGASTNLYCTKLVEGEVGLVLAKLEAAIPDAVLLAHLPRSSSLFL